MSEPSTLIMIALVFLLAGTVKGVIGLGLPTVSLGLLTAALDLTTAMALMIVPSFITNLWQALAGESTLKLLRRTGLFLATATVTISIGGLALARVDTTYLSGLLGVLLVVYAGLSLSGRRLTIPPGRETVAGPVFGLANGVLTGMTGSFVVPGVMYLQGLGLSRDELIQAMGMLFTVSTLALAVSLAGHGLLDKQISATSLYALVPALAGMVAGQRIRKSISEARFKKIFFVSILLLGAAIVMRVTFD